MTKNITKEQKLELALRQLENQNYHANSGDIAKRIRDFIDSDGKVCTQHLHIAAQVIECNDCQIGFI